MRVLPAWLAITQVLTFERADRAARRFEHRLRRAGVPLHGAPEPRVEIGDSFGQAAELHAGPEIDQLRHAPAAQEIIQPRAAAVVAAGKYRQPFLRRQARADLGLNRSHALPGAA